MVMRNGKAGWLMLVCFFVLLGCQSPPFSIGKGTAHSKTVLYDVSPDIERACLRIVNQIEAYVFEHGEIDKSSIKNELSELAETVRPDEFEPKTYSDDDVRAVNRTIRLAEDALSEDWNSFFDTYASLKSYFPLTQPEFEHDSDKMADSIIYDLYLKSFYPRQALYLSEAGAEKFADAVQEIKQSSTIEIGETIVSEEDGRRVKVTYRFVGEQFSDQATVIGLSTVNQTIFLRASCRY
ncbi:hypothetical protein [Cohnella hongkongensis]|uniref:Uncharacterized protein n=1 Tax=Cohnella hongkongensis TaxID=178337 RepID=A0ABV9FCQ4_9BACL